MTAAGSSAAMITSASRPLPAERGLRPRCLMTATISPNVETSRSEERRVGKGCRSRGYGIRDLTVTGVQTCALPIYVGRSGAQLTEDFEAVQLRHQQIEDDCSRIFRGDDHQCFTAVTGRERLETEMLDDGDHQSQRGDVEIGRASGRERV